MEPVNAAIIYYSATGTVHALAQAAAGGADKAGAHVRLRKVAELPPPEAINARPTWVQHLQDTADVAEVNLDDLAWADVVLFGAPTCFGNVPSCAERLAGASVPLVPVGPPVRAMVTGTTPPSAVDLHWRAAKLVAGQSGTVAAAAEGCDALMAGGVMQAGMRR
jgi:Flavodoxin-like fold